MPVRKLVQITSASYSRLGTYNTCPAKAKYNILDRIKEPSNQAMDNGTRVHDLAAKWATKKLKFLPTELERFAEEFEVLRSEKTKVEQDWVFRKDWSVTRFDDWNGAWLRMKVDAHYLAVTGTKTKRITRVYIIDHKTGKFSPDHALQRSLYAMGAFLIYPDAVEAIVSHWYLDQGVEEPEGGQVFKASQLESLQKTWTNKFKAMLSDTTFAPRPGTYCGYCYYSKSKNGPCKF